MGFISNIFGSKDEPPRGELSHAKDLCVGDLVKFGFLGQSDISNQKFEVVEVNTYDFPDEASTSFTLKGESGNIIYLSANSEDSEEYLTVSKKLTRSQVESIFDSTAFAEIFEEGSGTSLDVIETPDGLNKWLATRYIETEDCSQGYYHKGDYRTQDLPQYEDESTPLEYYLLEDENEDFAIEIEVYAGGNTEIYAAIYLELSAIDELWPANT